MIPIEPLSEAEFDWLDDILMKYGNDDSILDVSELDGFFTAIVSGPEVILPSQWFPALWGGEHNQPEWESDAEMQQFFKFAIHHMNFIVGMLMEQPEDFEALFNINPLRKETIYIVEEWCFGFMRGVDLGNWPELPDEVNTWLDAIALHGREEYFDVLRELSLEEHQQTVADIEPAVRKLHAYWLEKREHLRPEPMRVPPKVGRNEPCPCGSGKKYKQCCLH
ncbi:YecA/YgfB family protein [Thiomicrorhabdus cannonii]|uniref:YecA/YgfB family protein n=1 Tax=Thiomicrorhabdus cannonii TaxID=2748011 RepID=UPI001C4D066A|nr:YecA family protein [Thiomicrorhabdus cannonii]